MKHACSILFLLAFTVFCSGLSAQVIQNSNEGLTNSLLDSAQLMMEEDMPDKALKLVLNVQDLLINNDTAFSQRQKALQLTADAMAGMGEYKQAIPALREWMQIDKQMHGKTTLYYYLQQGTIGSYYMMEKDWAKARKEFLDARRSAHEVGLSRFIAGAENNLGILMSKMGKPDSALWYFKRAEEAIEFTQWLDSNLLARVRDNCAEVYAGQGKYEEALEIFEWEMEFFKGSVFPEKVALTGMRIAEIKLGLGRPEGLDDLLSAIVPYLVFENRKEQLENQIRLEKLWVSYADAMGDVALSALHSSKGFQFMESYLKYNEKAQNSVKEALKAYRLRTFLKEQELKEAKLSQAEAEIKQKDQLYRMVFWGISGMAILLVLVTWAILKKRSGYLALEKKLVEAQLRNQQLESANLKNALKHKEKDLEGVAMNINFSREYHTQVIHKLKDIAAKAPDGVTVELKSLINEMNAQTATHGKLQMVTENIDSVNSGFYHKLENQFPSLTKAEKEFCGMLRLNITGKEIAALRNVHPDSVKKTRQRLRKKLGLGPEEDIYKFIQGL